MNQQPPKPCIPDQNLLNVEEAAREAGKTGDVWISNETIEEMAREIREWRARFLLQDD